MEKENYPHSSIINPIMSSGQGVAAVIVCDYKEQCAQQSSLTASPNDLWSLINAYDARLLLSLCDLDQTSLDRCSTLLCGLHERIKNHPRQPLQFQTTCSKGECDGSLGMLMRRMGNGFGSAAISSPAGDVEKPAINREILILLDDFNSNRINDGELNDGEFDALIATMREAEENVRNKRNARKLSLGTGCNTKIELVKDAYSQEEMTALLFSIRTKVDAEKLEKMTFVQTKQFACEQMIVSMRASVALKEDGCLLLRQFGTLNESLQRKLLADPCFCRAHICRLQMYANFQ